MAPGPAEVTMAFSRLLDPRGQTPHWERRQSLTLPPEMVAAPHVRVQSTGQGALLVLVKLLICLSKVLFPPPPPGLLGVPVVVLRLPVSCRFYRHLSSAGKNRAAVAQLPHPQRHQSPHHHQMRGSSGRDTFQEWDRQEWDTLLPGRHLVPSPVMQLLAGPGKWGTTTRAWFSLP